MEDQATAKILKLLDVISVEVAANRHEIAANGREIAANRHEISELRSEVRSGFSRLERRLGNLEVRVETVETELRSFSRRVRTARYGARTLTETPARTAGVFFYRPVISPQTIDARRTHGWRTAAPTWVEETLARSSIAWKYVPPRILPEGDCRVDQNRAAPSAELDDLVDAAGLFGEVPQKIELFGIRQRTVEVWTVEDETE
jgi:hypothetical protein